MDDQYEFDLEPRLKRRIEDEKHKHRHRPKKKCFDDDDTEDVNE